MSFWRRLFGARQEPVAEPEKKVDSLTIAAKISPLLDQITLDVFSAHQKSLLAEPINFIVPAVWGASEAAPLTEEQKEIHSRVMPVIREVFSVMHLTGLDPAQVFAIDFLLRGLIINRITFTIEAARNRGLGQDEQHELLARMEPMGTA